ncbi:MAG: hypothetical protein KAI66_16695, partial [Lentisphaeria bacterium]|nr:hypothetical protein [Lentisphaeria bacterium]
MPDLNPAFDRLRLWQCFLLFESMEILACCSCLLQVKNIWRIRFAGLTAERSRRISLSLFLRASVPP